MGLLAALLAGTLCLENAQQRGVVWGAELPDIPYAYNSLGVNVFLDREPDEARMRRTLELARDMGAGFVKQLFPWEQIEPDVKGDFWDRRYGKSTWEHYDRIVTLCEEYGLQLIVRLDRPPPWARQKALAAPALQAALREEPDRDITGPPENLDDYGDFVYAVVSRYRGRIHYIQLWNEPNLANEWNWAPIDPQRFVALLRVGYARAKEADPNIVVLFPSLAPNDGLDPRHMSDLAFLQAVYEAGGAAYFDVMSAQLYGLGQPPTERSPIGFDWQKLRPVTRADVSRVVLLREIMERYGDAGKAVWVGELGWNATPPDWTGKPSPWGDPVSEEVKGQYIVEALDRSLREWPWMGVRSIWFLQWSGPPPKVDDPTQFFALVGYDFAPLPAYERVHDWAASTAEPLLGIGYHAACVAPVAERMFLGTRLDLVLPAGVDPQEVLPAVDGRPAELRFWRNEGKGSRYIAAQGLSDGRHTLSVKGPRSAFLGCYVVREQPAPWLFPALTAVLVLALVVVMAVLVPRLPTLLTALWNGAWRAVERFRTLPERWQALGVLGGIALALAAIYRTVPTPVALASLLLLGMLAVLRLDLALCAAAFVLPLYPQPAVLAGRQFSLFELMVLLCLAAGLLLWLRQLSPSPNPPVSPSPAPPVSPSPRFVLSSWFARHWREVLPAAAFLLICTGSLLWSTDRSYITADGTSLLRISLREYRVTIVEPFLLYPLLLLAFRGRRGRAWWVADALVLSAALVGIGGIVQVFDPRLHAEAVNGVRRATSVYALFSANTLALFLGRVLAIAVAGGLFLPWSRRRVLYGVALLPIGLCFYLTYSRAGYIAVALVLLVYGILRSRLLLLVEVGLGAAVAALAWITGALGRLLARDTLSNRIVMWQNTWLLVRKRPLQGWGLDTYYHYYRERFPGAEAYWNPNNGVLEFWTRIGLVGLAAAAWLYGAFFAAALRVFHKAAEPAGRVLALALLGSVVYALGHGLVDGTFFAPDWAATFWVAYGLVALLGAEEVTAQGTP
jgi:O-antigen ligase